MQIYTDPTRASDPHALPDAEVFHSSAFEVGESVAHGYYWQPCFPGCLPDGDPIGPFTTEEKAIEDAQGDES